MRIVMLAQFFPPIVGGEERHVETLSQALVGRGHDISVVTIQHGDMPRRAVQNGVTIHRIRGSVQRFPGLFGPDGRQHAPPFPDPELMAKIDRIVRREQPHIVHAHNWIVHSYLPIKRLHDAGLVLTLHDYSLVCTKKNMMADSVPCSGAALAKCLPCAGQHYGRLKGGIAALAARLSRTVAYAGVDKFLAVSDAVAERSGLTGSTCDFEKIPNFIPDDLHLTPADLTYADYLAKLPHGDFILFVGDLTHLKGLQTLLAAYRKLEDPPPLVLIGRRCLDTPAELPSNVRLFENWPHGAVVEAWRRCRFGVLASVGLEACATVVMEANAVGKPMIATRTGGMPEIVDDGSSGLLVPPGDEAALGEAIQRFLKDKQLRARMAVGASRKVTELMAAAVVPKIERAYSDVLARRGCRLTEDVRVSARNSPDAQFEACRSDRSTSR